MKLKLITILFIMFVSGKSNESIQKDNYHTGVFNTDQDSVITLSEFKITIDELKSISKWGRNPFLPYYSLLPKSHNNKDQISKILNPSLKEIFCENNQRKAKINNTIVKQGDFYLDMKVKYIGENLVILDQSNKEVMLLQIN